MGKITADQSQQIVASLVTNCNWEEIDFEALGLQDAIIRNSKEAGKQFTVFLKNRARMMIGDPRSILTQPFDPASFIGKGWTTWLGLADGDGLTGEEDVDPRGLALTELDVLKLLFETNLKKGEGPIKGEEKLRRQKAMTELIRLGGNAFMALWLDYQANKENSVLEWLYRTYKITFMDFMGQVLRSPNGDRRVLYLYRSDDGEWDWNYYWLGYDWDADNPSAVLAS